jgi:hypothetical protein
VSLSSDIGPNDWARVAVFCDDTSRTAALFRPCRKVGTTHLFQISILQNKLKLLTLLLVMMASFNNND